jgi:hypothetical protein
MDPGHRARTQRCSLGCCRAAPVCVSGGRLCTVRRTIRRRSRRSANHARGCPNSRYNLSAATPHVLVCSATQMALLDVSQGTLVCRTDGANVRYVAWGATVDQLTLRWCPKFKYHITLCSPKLHVHGSTMRCLRLSCSMHTACWCSSVRHAYTSRTHKLQRCNRATRGLSKYQDYRPSAVRCLGGRF